MLLWQRAQDEGRLPRQPLPRLRRCRRSAACRRLGRRHLRRRPPRRRCRPRRGSRLPRWRLCQCSHMRRPSVAAEQAAVPMHSQAPAPPGRGRRGRRRSRGRAASPRCDNNVPVALRLERCYASKQRKPSRGAPRQAPCWRGLDATSSRLPLQMSAGSKLSPVLSLLLSLKRSVQGPARGGDQPKRSKITAVQESGSSISLREFLC
mmetsp:Transcript_27622/g.91764  ORF Transcript_27622/g.91764 Transcript_27622/m.91764 type:complete len:206 (-) Transcript_27622:1114-1731(-)